LAIRLANDLNERFFRGGGERSPSKSHSSAKGEGMAFFLALRRVPLGVIGNLPPQYRQSKRVGPKKTVQCTQAKNVTNQHNNEEKEMGTGRRGGVPARHPACGRGPESARQRKCE